MKLTVLGVWGAYPEAESATSSYLLQDGDFNLLIDCGSGSLSMLQKYLPLEKLDALIVSHYHHDHIADIGCLQYGLMIQNQLGTRNGIFPIYGHNQDNEKFQRLNYPEVTNGIEISADKIIQVGPFNISFCPTIHPVYCLAIRISKESKSIVYTGDTEWSEKLVEFSKDADLIIADTNLYNDQLGNIKGHLTAGQAGTLAEQAKVKKLVLSHLPHHGYHSDLIKQAEEIYSGKVILATSGLTIDI